MKKIICALVFFCIFAVVTADSLVSLSSSFFSLFYNKSHIVEDKSSTIRDNNQHFQHHKLINQNIDKMLFKSFFKKLKVKKFKINKNIINSTKIFSNNSFATSVALYRPGEKRILVVRKGENKIKRINSIFENLIKHKRFDKVFRNGEKGVYLQIDEIEKPKGMVYASMSQTSLDSNRFEFGVDGFRISFPKQTIYFLPGDSFIFSIHSINQMNRFITRLVGGKNLYEATIEKIRSNSFIFDGNSVKALYRGFPVTTSINDIDLERVAYNSATYVVKHQDTEGKFLYYYDAKSDSRRDHQHPEREPKKNPYYNMLRHNGGGLLMLHEYERSGDPKFLEASKKAANFAVKQLKSYVTDDDKTASELFYNRKSKLGGAGTALYFLVRYQVISKDNSFAKEIENLKNHLLSQILESGEFIYYRVYLDKVVTEEQNKSYFNFYYPGEALCGLIEYYASIANDFKKDEMKAKILKALDFLVVSRPKLYPAHFKSLPSDSWLMMAINRLWDFKELREDRYKDFVISDANQMIEHMYTKEDALYPDYPGSFYYEYGDHPYPDGARAEGVVAAYELALKLKDKALIKKIEDAINLISLAVYRLVNIPETMYAVKNPKMSLWAIKFKLTRQWIRVDTIQHVAAFYSKYLFAKKRRHA